MIPEHLTSHHTPRDIHEKDIFEVAGDIRTLLPLTKSIGNLKVHYTPHPLSSGGFSHGIYEGFTLINSTQIPVIIKQYKSEGIDSLVFQEDYNQIAEVLGLPKVYGIRGETVLFENLNTEKTLYISGNNPHRDVPDNSISGFTNLEVFSKQLKESIVNATNNGYYIPGESYLYGISRSIDSRRCSNIDTTSQGLNIRVGDVDVIRKIDSNHLFYKNLETALIGIAVFINRYTKKNKQRKAINDIAKELHKEFPNIVFNSLVELLSLEKEEKSPEDTREIQYKDIVTLQSSSGEIFTKKGKIKLTILSDKQGIAISNQNKIATNIPLGDYYSHGISNQGNELQYDKNKDTWINNNGYPEHPVFLIWKNRKTGQVHIQNNNNDTLAISGF